MNDDFTLEGLNKEQTKVAKVVIATMKRFLDNPSGGGCKAFRTPKHHLEVMKESYGEGSVLILVHDGGDLAPFCNYDYCVYNKIDALSKALEPLGYYVENCTSWYSAVYKA